MNIFREIFDSVRFWWWDKEMELSHRHSEDEMWIVEDVKVSKRWTMVIIPAPRPRNWSSLLVACKLAQSNADAQRLIKGAAIEIRAWECSEPWKKIDFKSPLPTSPVFVRRGKAFFGIKRVWLPPAGVSHKFGELTVREGF